MLWDCFMLQHSLLHPGAAEMQDEPPKPRGSHPWGKAPLDFSFSALWSRHCTSRGTSEKAKGTAIPQRINTRVPEPQNRSKSPGQPPLPATLRLERPLR